MVSALACWQQAGWLAGLLGEYQFVVTGDAQPVGFVLVADRNFALPFEELVGLHGAGRG